MTFINYYTKKINPIYACKCVTKALLLFAAVELALMFFLALGLCEDCFENFWKFLATVFSWKTIILAIIIDAVGTILVVVFNRFQVKHHKRKMREFHKMQALERKRMAKRRRARMRHANRYERQDVRM